MRYFILNSVTAVLLALFSLNANAYDAYIDGIYYNLDANNNVATVTYGSNSYNSYSGIISIPSSITYGGKTYDVKIINDYAFSYCDGLASVSFPACLESIGKYAFNDCVNLRIDLRIPRTVTNIGIAAFSGCPNLLSIAVDNDNNYYDSRNNCNAIIETASNDLIAGCNISAIPNSVISINEGAFYACSGLTSVSFPENLTSIGNYAFAETGLNVVNIPNSVTYIGYSAFDDTPWYERQPNGALYLGRLLYKWKGAATSMPNNTSVIINDGTVGIVGEAFAGGRNMTSVTIPQSVTYIGKSAFSSCRGLTSVVIPENVKFIENHAFSYCVGLSEITIGCGVESIGNNAFLNCSALTSIILPLNIKKIDNLAFSGCERLASVISNIVIPFRFGNSAFYPIASTCTLTVPHGTKDAYIAKGWTTNVFKGGIVEAPPIYTKSFRSLVEDAEALVADNHYTTGQTALQAAITTAENAVASIVYVDDPNAEIKEEMATMNGQVIEVMTTLQAAIDEFVFGNDYVDATEKVQNPSFSVDGNNSKTVTSWVVTNFKQIRRDAATYTSTRKAQDGTAYTVHYFVEQWRNSSQGNLAGSGDIHQVITGLPAGHYRLTADCFAHNQLYTADCEDAEGIQLYVNDVVREIGMTGFDDATAAAFSVDFDIAEGEDATIGFRYSDTNVNWLGWDNVTLLYIGDPDTYQNQINAQSNNELSIANAEVCKGGSVVLPVELSNTESITATQFEVSLPIDVTISKCQLTNRKGEDHTASYKKLANGNYQVTVISLSKEVFSGTSGALLNLTLDVDDEMVAGDYPVGLTNIELTTADTKAINPADVSATLTISDVKVADADGNGKVTITDAVAIVSHILGDDINGFVAAAADVNGDGRITITDAVAVVDMILSGNASAKVRRDMEDNTLDPQ